MLFSYGAYLLHKTIPPLIPIMLSNTKLFAAFISMLLLRQDTLAQQVIGPIGSSLPEPSAMLKVQGQAGSPDRVGFIPPRMDSTQRKAITNPANGLWVFDNSTNQLFVFQSATGWKPISPSGSALRWLLTGNAGTDPSSQFIGTITAVPLRWKANNLPEGQFTGTDLYLGSESGLGSIPTPTSGAAHNIGIGRLSLRGDAAQKNIALGGLAMTKNTDGVENIAIGYNAMAEGTNLIRNISIGTETFFVAQSQLDYGIAIGYQAAFASRGGNGTIAIGKHAIKGNTSVPLEPSNITALGDSTLYLAATNNQSSVLGYGAGGAGNGLLHNTLVGFKTSFTAGGDYNTAVGTSALQTVTGNGEYNIGVGYQALQAVSTGQENAAIGFQAGSAVSNNPEKQIAIGAQAMQRASASTIVGIGKGSLQDQSGTNVVAIGVDQVDGTGTCVDLVAIGANQLRGSRTLNQAVVIGGRQLINNQPSQKLVAIGYNNLTSVSEGSNIVCIGFDQLLTQATSSNNISIGTNTSISNSTISQALLIGKDARTFTSLSASIGSAASNNFLLGSTTSAPAGSALVVGNTTANGNKAFLSDGGVWTNASDSNCKTSIQPIDYSWIVQQSMQLPIYHWRYRGTNEKHISPMAQDFHRIFQLSTNSETISTIDPSGVALALLQSLHIKQQKLAQRLQTLQQKINSKLHVTNLP